MHRIIGALSATNRGGIYTGLNRYAGSKQENYSLEYSTRQFLELVARNRLVFFGEIHSMPRIVDTQLEVLRAMKALPGTIHVIMEHFSFDMQHLLDDFQSKMLTFDELYERYRDIGTEGHNLQPYRELLEEATKEERNVKLHAGFLSRSYARQLMKEGEVVTLEAAAPWLKENTTKLVGSDFHYNIFESLLTGRNIHDGTPPTDQFKRIFQAQLLKDEAMAHRVNTLIQKSDDERDRFLVIAGNGHVINYQGVPERVLVQHPSLTNCCCLITSHEWDEDCISEKSIGDILDKFNFGPPGANPSDFLFVFQ
jgi:uncharacterized iron-regulated protein